MIYTINLRQIAALQHLATTGNVRYYLNGVHVTIDGNVVTCEATDGAAMGRFTEDLPNAGDPLGISIIIPIDAVKRIKLRKADDDHGMLIPLAANGVWAITNAAGLSVQFDAIDGTFPDTDRVIPPDSKDKPTPANYDFDLLAKSGKLGKAMHLQHPGTFTIDQRGESGAAVTHSALPGFVGVVMPFRPGVR